MIDLHTHTTASDGSCSPKELVELARQAHLEALAVTDHDTLAALPEARQAADAAGIEFVPGLELACRARRGTLHMLGYFIDHRSEALARLLAELIESRKVRNPRIIARLNELGYQMTMDQVRARAGGDIISRLHIAMVMAEKGYVRSIDEAFGRFLGTEGSAYVQRIEPEPSQAIQAIHQAEGLAVLAHPVHLQARNLPELNSRIEELAELGLDGLEVWYPEHDQKLTSELWRICQRLDLAPVGGSDFHGAGKSHIKLGRGRGGMNIPLEILHRLKTRLS